MEQERVRNVGDPLHGSQNRREHSGSGNYKQPMSNWYENIGLEDRLLTVTNASECGVSEDVVLVPVSKIAGLGEVASRKAVCKGGVMDGLNIHVVINLWEGKVQARTMVADDNNASLRSTSYQTVSE